MKYETLGLVNTRKMFADAISKKYAIPAFNFFNMETLGAIISAARKTKSPVILAVSESALKYMGADMLMGMILGLKLKSNDCVALHLDHGSSVESCMAAIDMGFSSVMLDASKLPFDKNVKMTRRVVEYAHKHNVSVESELGIIAGIEDENTHAKKSSYTDPDTAAEFIRQTGVDSLAIAIGTNHGAYKSKSKNIKLRFDILEQITERAPKFPLVLHGASQIPQKLIKTINTFGGKMSDARGIPTAQLRRAISMGICKINMDSDLRIGFTAGIRRTLAKNPKIFNPREYLGVAADTVQKGCIDTIKNIMKSGK